MINKDLLLIILIAYTGVAEEQIYDRIYKESLRKILRRLSLYILCSPGFTIPDIGSYIVIKFWFMADQQNTAFKSLKGPF